MTQMNNPIKLSDIYWIAGLLEGEGCFQMPIRADANNSTRFIIELSSTDKDVVTRASCIMRGSWNERVYSRFKKNGNKTVHTTFVSGLRAIGWMMTIYPLMSNRRKIKIKEIISHWKTYKSYYNSRPLRAFHRDLVQKGVRND